MNDHKTPENAQKPNLLPFYAFPEPIDNASYLVLIEQAKQQYTGWLRRSRTCEINSHSALTERDFDYWHDLFLEADMESTYYWQALKVNGALPEEN